MWLKKLNIITKDSDFLFKNETGRSNRNSEWGVFISREGWEMFPNV